MFEKMAEDILSAANRKIAGWRNSLIKSKQRMGQQATTYDLQNVLSAMKSQMEKGWNGYTLAPNMQTKLEKILERAEEVSLPKRIISTLKGEDWRRSAREKALKLEAFHDRVRANLTEGASPREFAALKRGLTPGNGSLPLLDRASLGQYAPLEELKNKVDSLMREEYVAPLYRDGIRLHRSI